MQTSPSAGSCSTLTEIYQPLSFCLSACLHLSVHLPLLASSVSLSCLWCVRLCLCLCICLCFCVFFCVFVYFQDASSLQYQRFNMFCCLMFSLTASDRMKELSEVFAGKTPLSRVEKSEMLQKYFEKLSEQIAALEHDDSTAAGRKITNLIAALDDVQEFHQLQNSLQIRQFLTETQLSLKQMLRVINIQCDFIEALQSILDLSYVWLIIDNYTSFMQAAVKRDPAIVIKLRATFLKLAAAIEIPVLRMLSSTARILRALWTTTALRLSPMSARCCKLFLPPCSRFWPRSFRRNG
eukprot:m.729018 g.729018  ORF g.729018 m.729018 type:complete len:295 (-) comp58870_c0_seq37:330-1214(-)